MVFLARKRSVSALGLRKPACSANARIKHGLRIGDTRTPVFRCWRQFTTSRLDVYSYALWVNQHSVRDKNFSDPQIERATRCGESNARIAPRGASRFIGASGGKRRDVAVTGPATDSICRPAGLRMLTGSEPNP